MKGKRLRWSIGLGLAMVATLLIAALGELPKTGAQGSPAVSIQWAQRAPMPTPRHTGAAVAVDGVIYTIGGVGGLTYTLFTPFPGGPTYSIPGATLEAYNSATGSWAAKTPMPRSEGRWGLAAAAYGGKIYTFGGASLTGGPTSTVDVYDIATDAWTLDFAALPAPVTGMAAVAYGDSIYLFGGSSSTEVFAPENYYGNVYRFNPATRTFTPKATLPNARTTAFAVVQGSEIYVLGGVSGWGNRNNQVYSPVTDSWRVERPLVWERAGWTGAAANGMFFVIGLTLEDVPTAQPTADTYLPTQGAWASATPPSTARNYAFTAGVGGKLYVMGGLDTQGNTLSVVEEGTVPTVPPTVQPTPTPAATTLVSWASKASMPTPRTFGATVVVDGIIYTIGGIDSASRTSTVMESYDPAVNTWARKADLPYGRWGLAAAAYGGKIYTFGGADMTLRVTNTVAMYDIASNTWTANIATLPQAATGITAVTYGDKIYLFGGSRNPQLFAPASNYFNNVYEFNAQTRTFTPKAAMPVSRNLSFGGVMGDKIYNIGGVESRGATGTRISSPASDSWSEGASLPERRGGHSGAIAGDKVYILGGHNENTVYAYDPAQDSWSRATPMTTGRNVSFSAGVNDRIYVMGGSDSVGNTTGSVEEGTPAGVARATPTPVPTATPTPTATPVPTLTPTATPIPSPTPTSTPTRTPTPRPTTTPGPTATPPAPGAGVKFYTGWNNFLYLGQTQPLPQALAPLEDKYSIVYRWDNSIKDWQSYSPTLPPFANSLTELRFGDPYWIYATEDANLAFSPTTRPGTGQVSLVRGWNNIGYRGQTGPAQDGLASIAGKYAILYHWVNGDKTWQSYSPTVPPFANTVQELRFGEAYWIYATEDTVLSY